MSEQWKASNLQYRYANWENIEMWQERKWASKASDVTITKPDGTVEVRPNSVKPFIPKKKRKKGLNKKRQQMFDGNYIKGKDDV